jgi:hypothetical protein
MIGNLVARDFAGGLGLRDGVLEIVPLGIAEQALKVAGEPVFLSVIAQVLRVHGLKSS